MAISYFVKSLPSENCSVRIYGLFFRKFDYAETHFLNSSLEARLVLSEVGEVRLHLVLSKSDSLHKLDFVLYAFTAAEEPASE
jgi:hypothetical protein